VALAGEPRSGAQGVPWLREVAQKQEGSGRSSPRGSRRSDLQRRGPATSTGGGEGAAFVVRAARGSSRRLDSLDRRVAALRSKTGGQRGTGDAGGVNSSERRNSPSSDSRANSGEVGPGLWGKDLGEVPGCTAVLLRCGAGPGRRWRGRSAAAQGGRRGGAERRGGSRALDGAERKMECR